MARRAGRLRGRMAEGEAEDAVSRRNRLAETVLQVVALVHDHEIEDRERGADRAGEVLLELVARAQVEGLAVGPGQMREQLVAPPPPSLGVLPERQAEARQPGEEVAVGIEARLADQLDEAMAGHDAPR